MKNLKTFVVLGGFVSLNPQTIVEVLGFDKVARMIGLMSFATGIAFLLSPPLSGKSIQEYTCIRVYMENTRRNYPRNICF